MDDDLKKLLQETMLKAQTPQKLPIQGPGPFELPLVDDVTIQRREDHFVLEFQLSGTRQTVRIPLTAGALSTLGTLAIAFLPPPKTSGQVN